jgi:hypothetical protein
VITESLCNLMAQETLCIKGNSKKTELKNLLAEEGSNPKTNVGAITDNKRADKTAMNALDQNVETTIKVVKSDYCKWVKEKIRQRWQNEWKSSTSSMVTIKPHVNKYDSTKGLPR